MEILLACLLFLLLYALAVAALNGAFRALPARKLTKGERRRASTYACSHDQLARGE